MRRLTEPDAPLDCRAAAINIHTVFDAQADADYNAGVFPLLQAGGTKLLWVSGLAPIDVLGTSKPEWVQGFQGAPWYAGAAGLANMVSSAAYYPLFLIKALQVGESLHFGMQTCLYDCAALESSASLPIFAPGDRKLVVHLQADRGTIEASVAGLAADADTLFDVTLGWVGRTMADIFLEEADGDVVSPGEFTALGADMTVLYVIDPLTDPATVLATPTLAGLLAGSAEKAAVILP